MTGSSVIVDKSRRAGGWGAIVLGTIFGGFGAMFIFLVAFVSPMDFGPFMLFFLAIPGLFAIGGGFAVVRGVRNVWLSHVLGTPTLTVPQGQPLYLGGELVAQFHRSGG